MRADEAEAVAEPVARLLARRFHLRGDLADATDVASGGASAVSWIERVLTQPVLVNVGPIVAEAPARAPEPVTALHGEPEPPAARRVQRPAPPPPTPAAAAVVDQGGNAVPGSGPTRDAFLAGFDNVGEP